MATATEERILVSLNIAPALATALDQESDRTGLALAPLMRRMVKWHRGHALGRHPSNPKVTLPTRPPKTKVTKAVLLEEEDAAHLDAIARRVGVPRVTALAMVVLAWFEIDAFAPLPSKMKK